jgi:DNA repair protein SbcD/Mre11
MIRILHTSDWHLGKRLERFSRHDEQVAVLNEIIEVADRWEVDAILVAGDLFDAYNPPAESLELFYKSLKRLSRNGSRPVIAIAGNHDMPERIEAPDPLARECGILFAGFPESEIAPFSLENGFSLTRSAPGFLEIQMPEKPPMRVLLTPYANEMRLRKGLDPEHTEEELRNLLTAHWNKLANEFCDTSGINIMLAHLLMMPENGEVPEEPDDERPINHIGGAQVIYTSSIPDSVQYSALGHLHRKQSISGAHGPVVYSGSPLSYSFSEAGQQKQVILIEMDPGSKAVIRTIDLLSGRRLERKRFENISDAESWLISHPDSLVELTLVSETFLSGNDRRRLYEVHRGIVAIIPEIIGVMSETGESGADTIQHKGLLELFTDYFLNRKGQEPDQALMDLFREINAEEDEL